MSGRPGRSAHTSIDRLRATARGVLVPVTVIEGQSPPTADVDRAALVRQYEQARDGKLKRKTARVGGGWITHVPELNGLGGYAVGSTRREAEADLIGRIGELAAGLRASLKEPRDSSTGVRLADLLEVLLSLSPKPGAIVQVSDLEVVFSTAQRRTIESALRILMHQGSVELVPGAVRLVDPGGFAPVSYTQAGRRWTACIPNVRDLQGIGSSKATALANLFSIVDALQARLLRAEGALLIARQGGRT